MKGYVTQKGTRWYTVVYEGLDPVTAKAQVNDLGLRTFVGGGGRI